MAIGRKKIVVYAETLPQLGGGEKHGLALLAPLAGLHDITVLHRGAPFDPAAVSHRFGLELPGIRYDTVQSTLELLRRARSADLFINVTYASVVPNPARAGLLLVLFPMPLDDYPAASNAWRCVGHGIERARQSVLAKIEHWAPDLNGGVAEFLAEHGTARTVARLPLFFTRKAAWAGFRDLRLGRHAIGTYSKLLANSKYTAGWTERYYGRTADLCFPPIDTDAFRPDFKREEIVAVGRFDDGENAKRFDVLIDAFREGFEAGFLRDWTLRICGGVRGAASEAYVSRLRASAEGLPIRLETNVSIATLGERYARARLFWHAMGFGADSERTPWKLEHFGMTTAEAMAAGCVPMVFDAAGPAEIVQGDVCGYRWRTTAGLLSAVRHFQSLSADAAGAMADAARERAENFSYANFFARTAALYEGLGIPCRSPAETAAAQCGPTVEALQ